MSMDQYDVHDPRFLRYVLPNARLQTLGEGYDWLEGPVWFADHDCLLASDLPGDRILRWTESSGVTTFRQPSGFANGHTRDTAGRLIGCSHRHRHIERTELDGQITILASHYDGKRLNSPNDVVCRSDGTIWFTDPHYGINTDYEGGKQTPELPPGVYCLDPTTRALSLVAGDFQGPNGLCFSPDERLLYISDAGHQFDPNPTQSIRVFDVHDTTLSAGREFHHVTPGFADGVRCDKDGNVWTSAADGVHCITPDGTLLGRIKVPHLVSNLTFGGRNHARLFLCASHTLYAIYTNTRGAQRP